MNNFFYNCHITEAHEQVRRWQAKGKCRQPLVVDLPKATAKFSQEELIRQGLVGLYREKQNGKQDQPGS